MFCFEFLLKMTAGGVCLAMRIGLLKIKTKTAEKDLIHIRPESLKRT